MFNNSSVIVALAILILITIIGVTAILKYEVEGALKIFGVLSGLFGVVTGAFVSYFFTHQKIELQQKQVRSLIKEVNYLSKENTLLAKNTIDFTNKAQGIIQVYNETNGFDVSAFETSMSRYQSNAKDYEATTFDSDSSNNLKNINKIQ